MALRYLLSVTLECPVHKPSNDLHKTAKDEIRGDYVAGRGHAGSPGSDGASPYPELPELN
jgi:hypothetical protein